MIMMTVVMMTPKRMLFTDSSGTRSRSHPTSRSRRLKATSRRGWTFSSA